jgi:chemotaxis protein methyltransferase CheR
MVNFGRVNLTDARYDVKGPFDAIFCRNVMIYFDKPTQAQVLSRFEPLMKPGALLFAGHSENFTYVTQAFRLRGQTVYELARDAKAGAHSKHARVLAGEVA